MNKKAAQPEVAYYNQTAHEQFLSQIERQAEKMNNALAIWNSLEVDQIGPEDLPSLIAFDAVYFKKLYKDRVWAMIDQLKIPTPTKTKLLEESLSSAINDLTELLNRFSNSSFVTGAIAMGGGFRSFEVQPDYFELSEGSVIVGKDVRDKTIGFFQVLTDTPEKAQAVALLHEVAEKLTLATQLLEETGLYGAKHNPIILQSPIFLLNDDVYRARVEALL